MPLFGDVVVERKHKVLQPATKIAIPRVGSRLSEPPSILWLGSFRATTYYIILQIQF